MQFPFIYLRHKLAILAILVVGMLLAGCAALPLPAPPAPAAQQPETGDEDAAPAATAQIPQVPMEITSDGVTFPDPVPSGLVTFDVQTEALPASDASQMGPTWVAPIIARLNEDVTLDDLIEQTEGVGPAAAAPLADLYGGLFTQVPAIANESEIVYNLTPGDYVAVHLAPGAPPMYGSFTTVQPSKAPAPPATDVNVELVDFGFAMPGQVASGEQTWEIANTGEQFHEILVIQMNEGITQEDVLAYMQASEETGGEAGPPPFQIVAGFGPVEPGNTAWVTWELPPGEYTAICLLPNIEGDMTSHAALGMIQPLTVTE